MTEMNELTRSLARVEELLNAEQCAGALNCLWISQEHARQAIKLIKDQAALLTKQQLEIITLNKDVEIQKERADMQYKRAVSAEAEIKELDEQEPIANIGDSYGLFWIGSGPIAPIVQRNNLKVGDKLYARPVPAKPVPERDEESSYHHWTWNVKDSSEVFKDPSVAAKAAWMARAKLSKGE